MDNGRKLRRDYFEVARAFRKTTPNTLDVISEKLRVTLTPRHIMCPISLDRRTNATNSSGMRMSRNDEHKHKS